MNYIEKVNWARGPVTDKVAMPPEVLSFALSLKQPPALADRNVPEALQQFEGVELETQLAREVGNRSVRLALASYLAAQHDSSITYLGSMPAEQQQEILALIMPDDSGYWPQICFGDTEVRKHLQRTKQAEQMSWLKRIARYADVRPGRVTAETFGHLPIGNHDVTLTQAFGRNAIPDRELAEVGRQRKGCGLDEAFFAQYLDGFDPGESNRALAGVIAAELDSPAVIEQVVQWEVAYALWKKKPDLFAHYQSRIHVVWPQRNFYPTYEVKRGSLAVMEKKGLYHAQELTHPDMMVRALGILSQLGVEADAVFAKVPYGGPDSVQVQTRSPGLWTGREWLARLEHVLRGRVRL